MKCIENMDILSKNILLLHNRRNNHDWNVSEWDEPNSAWNPPRRAFKLLGRQLWDSEQVLKLISCRDALMLWKNEQFLLTNGDD